LAAAAVVRHADGEYAQYEAAHFNYPSYMFDLFTVNRYTDQTEEQRKQPNYRKSVSTAYSTLDANKCYVATLLFLSG